MTKSKGWRIPMGRHEDANGKGGRCRLLNPASRRCGGAADRRSMARLLRARGVPMADTAAWLGHSLRGLTTTEAYADVDPLYLQPPRAAIDALAREIDAAMVGDRRLLARHGDPSTDQMPTEHEIGRPRAR